MRYEEHRPHPALAPLVECLWLACDREATSARPPERVLPDGCLEWIFHLGAPFRRCFARGHTEIQPASFVVGGLTRHIVIQPTGPVTTFGVRFRPGGAYRFLPVPLEELTDTALPTADVFGPFGRRVEEEVLGAKNDASRRRIIERFLRTRLAAAPAARPRFEAAVNFLVGSGGRARVASVAARVGASTRQLERDFDVDLGLSPKALARILRFQNALRLSGRQPLRSWADVAAECGYADQAHLVREFQSFAGAAPTERTATDGDLTHHFLEPTRLDALLSPLDVAFVQDGAPPRH